MGQGRQKVVLFLCTGNYYRSRFAEASSTPSPARWACRGRPRRGAWPWNEVSPTAGRWPRPPSRALLALGVRPGEAFARLPAQVTGEELEGADRIVALKQAEHLPLLQERFPTWAEKVELWQVEDDPEALALIEREIMGLVARLLGGGDRPDLPAEESPPRIDRQNSS